MGSENPTGAENQQETERDPQRLHAEHLIELVAISVKIQSDLHGDMQSHAEMS